MKYIATVTLGLVVMAIIAGCIHKSAYTNYTKDSLDSFEVALLDYELAENMKEIMMESLELECEYIVRVRAVTGLQFFFLSSKQRVEVREVYKGDDVEVGEEIDVAVTDMFYGDEGMSRSLGLGFVNAMEPNEEYLLFLKSKVVSDFSYEDNLPYDVYRSSDFVVAPIFAYQERESVPITPDGEVDDERLSKVPYSEVKGYEYFVESQEALDCLRELRAAMIERYPR